MWDFSRLPLVGGGAFPGGGIFSRNYEEFSTGVDSWEERVIIFGGVVIEPGGQPGG